MDGFNRQTRTDEGVTVVELEELRNRLTDFAGTYCGKDVDPDNLRFISDMCYAIGVEPNIVLRKPRKMVAGDIGVTVLSRRPA